MPTLGNHNCSLETAQLLEPTSPASSCSPESSRYSTTQDLMSEVTALASEGEVVSEYSSPRGITTIRRMQTEGKQSYGSSFVYSNYTHVYRAGQLIENPNRVSALERGMHPFSPQKHFKVDTRSHIRPQKEIESTYVIFTAGDKQGEHYLSTPSFGIKQAIAEIHIPKDPEGKNLLKYLIYCGPPVSDENRVVSLFAEEGTSHIIIIVSNETSDGELEEFRLKLDSSFDLYELPDEQRKVLSPLIAGLNTHLPGVIALNNNDKIEICGVNLSSLDNSSITKEFLDEMFGNLHTRMMQAYKDRRALFNQQNIPEYLKQLSGKKEVFGQRELEAELMGIHANDIGILRRLAAQLKEAEVLTGGAELQWAERARDILYSLRGCIIKGSYLGTVAKSIARAISDQQNRELGSHVSNKNKSVRTQHDITLDTTNSISRQKCSEVLQSQNEKMVVADFASLKKDVPTKDPILNTSDQITNLVAKHVPQFLNYKEFFKETIRPYKKRKQSTETDMKHKGNKTVEALMPSYSQRPVGKSISKGITQLEKSKNITDIVEPIDDFQPHVITDRESQSITDFLQELNDENTPVEIFRKAIGFEDSLGSKRTKGMNVVDAFRTIMQCMTNAGVAEIDEMDKVPGTREQVRILAKLQLAIQNGLTIYEPEFIGLTRLARRMKDVTVAYIFERAVEDNSLDEHPGAKQTVSNRAIARLLTQERTPGEQITILAQLSKHGATKKQIKRIVQHQTAVCKRRKRAAVEKVREI